MVRGIMIVLLSVYIMAPLYGALGTVQNGDTVVAWNTQSTYIMKFLQETGGLNMFWFSDTMTENRQDVELDADTGRFILGQYGGNVPDRTLLMIGVEDGTVDDGFTIRISVDDYDDYGENPVLLYDTVITGDVFTSYGYGPQTYKPYYPQGDTGLPLVSNRNGPAYTLLFVDIHPAFTKQISDYIAITYDLADSYTGRVCFNAYGYRALDDGIIWTNPTAIKSPTTSLLIRREAVGMTIVPSGVTAGRLLDGTVYDILGTRHSLGQLKQPGIYLKIDCHGNAIKVLK